MGRQEMWAGSGQRSIVLYVTGVGTGWAGGGQVWREGEVSRGGGHGRWGGDGCGSLTEVSMFFGLFSAKYLLRS